LSYTRAQAIAYHATDGASTAMRPVQSRRGPAKSSVFHRPSRPARPALNMARFAAYIEISINNERR
jgi:hypothetical protein